MPKLCAAEFHLRDYDPRGQWCLLYGPEYELKARARDGVIKRLVPPADREYAVETIALSRASRAASIVGAAQSGSMLSATRVLVADGIENLSNGEQRELARSLAAAPGTTVILIESPRSGRGEYDATGADRKGRLSTELIKAIAVAGAAVECLAPTRDEATRWVIDHARSLGTPIKPAVASLLVARVGLDLGRLAREVEKLALLAADEGTITREHIEAATPRTPEDNIFAVGDAIGAGDADQALAVLRDLMHYQGVEPTTALVFVTRQIRLIWQAKILLDHGWRPGREPPEGIESLLPEGSDILRMLEGRAWLVNRLAGQARRINWPQLTYAIRRLLTAELTLKGIGEGVAEPQVALELLVVDLCRPQAGQRAASPDG
jgi:DNA polymerase-3 subunit delta